MSAPQSPRMAKPSPQSTLSNPSGAETFIQQSESLQQEESVASSQTRFSFYNAEEFKVLVPPKEPPEKQRFNYYNAEEIKLTQTVVETVEAQAKAEEQETDDKNLDSGEILKSLQAHEQQRLEILAGPKKTENESSNSQTNDNSNPYEDAIKEALQLLRKHRTPSTTREQRTATTSQVKDEQQTDLQKEFQNLLIGTRTPAAPLTAASAPGHSHEWDDLTLLPSAASMTTPLSDTNLGEAYQTEIENRRKQRQERMARYASRLAELKQEGNDEGPPVVDTSRSMDSDIVASTTNGIARGSSSLQHDWTQGDNRASWEDDDDAIVANRSDLEPTPNVVYPAVSYTGSLSTLSNAQKEEEVQRGVERVLLAILERANSRGRSATQTQTSSSGTFETSSGEVQGVNQDEEKKSNSEDRESNPASFQQRNDDALFRAMSEILGRPSSSIPSAAIHNEAEDPSSTSLATQEEPTTSLAATQERSHSIDDAAFPKVVVADSSSNLCMDEDHKDCDSDRSQHVRAQSIAANAGSEVRSDNDSAAHEELDRMVERVFGQDENDRGGESNVGTSNNGDVKEVQKEFISDARRKEKRKTHVVESRPHRSSRDSESETQPDDNYERGRSLDISANDSGSEIEDDTIQDTTLEDALGTTDDDDEYTSDDDDDSSDEYTSDDASDKFIGALGPRARRSGGTTGVVLDADDSSSSSTSSSEGENRNNRSVASPPTILESLSAAVSMVTGGKTYDDKQKSLGLATKDKYAREGSSKTKDEGDSDADSEANDLMRSLCAHLLPFGVDKSSRLLEKLPEWDDGDPDEPGYRIVRLNSYQLRRVQREYDRMIERLKRKSQLNLSYPEDSATDETAFERDLRAAEDLLEEEEKRLKTAENVLSGHSDKANSVSSQNGQPIEPIDLVDGPNGEFHESECLAGFPGVRPAGKGEMGDLEYFSLPVIFKSHVTGFEPTKDMVLEAGNVVAGQYLVEGVLGSAAFSTAYKCIDLNSEEDSSGNQEMVCLKVIKNTKDFFDQSLDEIKILELLRQTGKCNENYIVEMKTFFYHREHLIIVTELLRQNLFEFGKFIVDSGEEPYFTIDRLSYITRQCLIALNFVHKIGLVHSDVKPENILLGSYSRAQVKLIDFGSSCYLTDRQSSYIQSRSYRAPEVVLGLPYDGRIDVWSLGCVVAEMFTGEVTFQNDSIVSMLSRIEAICGPFPRHMISHGRQSGRFFTKCGLLFEKVTKDSGTNNESSSDDSSDSEERQELLHFDIFQPKRTSLSSRLGFAPELMERYDSGKQLSGDERRQAMFVDLVRRLLTIDPETRPTAAEALEHPLMLYAATLSEDDIKYPSS